MGSFLSVFDAAATTWLTMGLIAFGGGLIGTLAARGLAQMLSIYEWK